jgi:hypothetical protein
MVVDPYLALLHPNLDTVIMHIDASNRGIGAILRQVLSINSPRIDSVI